MPAVLLAIEASQRAGGVAVRDRDGAVHAEPLRAEARHDEDLLPAIDRLLGREGLGARDLEAVAVSAGPGGFTGLRVSVATAKVLAETLGARLVAVPTALVVAESYRGEGPILVALSGKGATCWCTRIDRSAGGNWSIAEEPGLRDAETLWLKGIKALLGDRHLPAPVRRRCGAEAVRLVEPVFDPVACLRVASRMLDAGQTTDPAALGPVYPRPPAVTEPRRGARS